MKLDANRFAVAAAIAVALLWVACSLIVIALPGLSMHASGYMMHADFSGMGWSMHLAGFLWGLVLWVFTAAVSGWLLATIYNKLLGSEG